MTEFGELGISVNARGAVEQRTRCPRCSKRQRDDALGVNIETGAFHCFRCGWKGRAGGDSNTPEPRPITSIGDHGIAERKRERLRRIWRDTVPLEHRNAYAVRQYLEARALGEVLKDPPPGLRAHPAVEYWDGTESLGAFPAMIAMLHNPDNVPITLHCTFLRQDGCAKAGVPSPKKILGVPVRGATKGAAIRLYSPRSGVLGVAEGIESALSLHLIVKIPTWAAFCADNLVRVQLPSDLRELHIGVDLDESHKGEQVALGLAKRVHQRSPHMRIFIVRPELDGFGDLNDELLHRGLG